MRAGSASRVGLDLRLTYYTAGGIAKYIRRLAERLPAQAPEFAHTHFYRRGHAATYSEAARRVECWTPAHHRLERWTLAAEISPHRLDLLHSPDFIPPQTGYRHAIITVHDLTFLLYPQFLTPESRRYYAGQIGWAVKRASAISADSLATKADLVNLLAVPEEKVTVIYLGAEADFMPASEATRAGREALAARLSLTPGFILFVGTFEPRKNVPGLLAAYARLRQDAPDAPPLVLAGRRGWLFSETLARIDELGLTRHVHILEEVAPGDLQLLYQMAGVFVLPSHYEGFGITVLEAMASGSPVIIADRASLPEIAGDAALKVDPDDTDQIADAILRVLTDSDLRAALIVRGLARVSEFNWDSTALETRALYHRVLEG